MGQLSGLIKPSGDLITAGSSQGVICLWGNDKEVLRELGLVPIQKVKWSVLDGRVEGSTIGEERKGDVGVPILLISMSRRVWLKRSTRPAV